MSLNKEQALAATTINGPLLILAGAGTGKTHTLIARISCMVEHGVNPSNILLLTFTNKAANEMVERAAKDLGGDLSGLTACTFHSFCVKIIFMFANRIGMEKGFTLLTGGDATDAVSIAKAEMLEKMKSSDKPEERATASMISSATDFPPCTNIKNCHSKAINTQKTLDSVLAFDKKCSGYIDECKLICKEYQKYKKDHNMLDYDDLMLKFIQILTNCPDVAEFVRGKYRYIMVDEYQDTNGIQLDMIKLLCPPNRTNNLAVVGDEMQAIYGFRGSNFKNILNFEKLYPGTKKIILNRNYRSNQEILDMANAIVSSAKEKFNKGLHTDVVKGLKPTVIMPADNNEENYLILKDVKNRLAHGEQPNSMCILIRNATDSFSLETLFTTEKIPYKKLGGTKLFDKAYVRDIFAFLKVTFNPKDELAWFRLFQLYYGIGEVNAKKLVNKIIINGVDELTSSDYSRKVFYDSLLQLYDIYCKLIDMDFDMQLDFILEYYFNHMRKLIEDRAYKTSDKEKELKQLDNDQKESGIIKELAEDYKSAQEFINAVAIETPSKQDENSKIVISTIHSAKGLEWNTVYMMDCVSGKFPRTTATPEETEEERRIFYVAVTRARDNLTLYAPKKTKMWGRFFDTTPCQYLDESVSVKNSYITA